jgi:hypothetical protein
VTFQNDPAEAKVDPTKHGLSIRDKSSSSVSALIEEAERLLKEMGGWHTGPFYTSDVEGPDGEDSHVKLTKWLQAIYLIGASKKGISAHQLHRMLGVTYRAAWFMAHRLRYAMNVEPLPETARGTKRRPRTRAAHSGPCLSTDGGDLQRWSHIPPASLVQSDQSVVGVLPLSSGRFSPALFGRQVEPELNAGAAKLLGHPVAQFAHVVAHRGHRKV